ncbi:alpha/beta hydrolase family protein [Lacibacter cauensis]|uniref:alpha/beta hydrolase family protein n=1 Tax=Lacibacter cauensis TaxID=510947 RepID=UPI001315625B|nr:alpha/beta fold hydrolase [Lacibacter cauensis]
MKLKGREIVVTIFQSDAPVCSIVLAGAAGVVQDYYRDFADWLSRQGCVVVTFDYSGIGKSLKGSLKSVNSDLLHWAEELDAVIQLGRDLSPTYRVMVIGHSLGGQLIGFSKRSLQCERIVLIAAQSGYWRHWKGLKRIRMFFTWFFWVPLVTYSKGYFSAIGYSKIEDLPANAALQWAKWCRHRHYYYCDKDNFKNYFKYFMGNIIAVSFTDDDYAPQNATDWLSDQYSAAVLSKLHFHPAQLQSKKIGHFGFFKRGNERVWPLIMHSFFPLNIGS